MSIEVYIGDPIDQASERDGLRRVAEHIAALGEPAVLLANINMAGRQIDLVIALNHLTLVLEEKAYAVPVQGGVNGLWQVRLASGEWKNTPNLYLQTVSAKNALRDEMAAYSNNNVAYPDAALTFVPSIPSESLVFAGDFKASVVGMEKLPTLLKRRDNQHWTLEQWRKFAEYHRLYRVGSVQAAFDPAYLDAEQALNSYNRAFHQTYAPVVEDFVSVPCIDDGNAKSFEELSDQIARGASFLVKGPSGCGKTLAAIRAGLNCFVEGRVPIILYAKDFVGKLKDVLDREAVLLDVASARDLLNACRTLGQPVTFVVDGFNECAEVHRSHLTRSIAAVCRRYLASTIITTSIPLERDDLLKIRTIEVPSPSLAMKKAVAVQAHDRIPLPENLLHLLESITSNLEARLVGEIGLTLSPNTSRYALFDGFVRKRLGSDANLAIRALTLVAGLLVERLSFILSVRDLGRLIDAEGIPASVIQKLQDAKLLVVRGDRTGFGHELYLNAFAAEFIIRKANGNASKINVALRAPQNTDRKALIIGAIDDAVLQTAVLSEVTDPQTVVACADGQCGQSAKAWAEQRSREVLLRVREEIGQIRFRIEKNGYWDAEAEPDSLLPWNEQEKAAIAAIPGFITDGWMLDDVLSVIGEMDQKIAQEFTRLRDEAREKKVALRSGLFANCYLGFSSNRPALAFITNALHGGFISAKEKPNLLEPLRRRLSRDDLTHGQLYLLLMMFRGVVYDDPSLASAIPEIIQRFWPSAAYHLRLDLLDAARSAGHKASEEDRKRIIAVIEEIPNANNAGWGISSSIVDALKGLGALDDSQEEHIEVVRQNIRDVLASPNDPDMQALASGIWSSQFDHPYDGAYYEAIDELPPADKKTLIRLAAQGAGDYLSFITILILQLAAFGDPNDGAVIARWASLPDKKSVMPQDAIGAFAIAHVSLARLACPLPPMTLEPANDAERAMAACGRILYWINRIDMPFAERLREGAEGLAILCDSECSAAASVVRAFESEHRYWSEGVSRIEGEEPVRVSLAEVFPDEMAVIARHCLANPERQTGYFNYVDPIQIFTFAIQVLASFGNASDIASLKSLVPIEKLGHAALRAIAALEAASA